MATPKATIHPFPAQVQPIITTDQISRYAEVSALLNQPEAQQKSLRSELLGLYSAGATQETNSSYFLNFVEQDRRNVDWKQHAVALAEKLFGIEQAAMWTNTVEKTAPVTHLVQIRVKPNPVFAAGLVSKVSN